MLLKSICEKKRYAWETFYLATTLVDRYLALLNDQVYPDLLELAVCTLNLAAKLNESLEPNIMSTIKLLPDIKDYYAFKKNVLMLEREFIREFNWDLNWPSAMIFAERYLRLLNLHEHHSIIEFCHKIYRGTISRVNICLKQRPSHLGAAIVLIA